MLPRVSVVITAYNLGWCLRETLESVLAQTYSNREIILVDDASTDDTPAQVAPFLDRIRYIRHETNQGRAKGAEGGPSRNTGIAAATGDYIAFLDGDDAWEPEKLALQVEAALQHPNAGLIVADGVLFAHEDGRVLRPSLLHDYGEGGCSGIPSGVTQVVDLYAQFLRGCVIDTPSQVMVSKKVLGSVGGFACCAADDYEFYLRVASRFPSVIIKRPLVRYRYHVTSISGALDRQYFRFAQPNINIWRRHLRDCRPQAAPVLREQLRKFRRTVAKRALEQGRRGDRPWASRFLRGFLARNFGASGSLTIARCWLRLWTPDWLTRSGRSALAARG